ncbi:MAG TPA: carboxypeptidase-like regulatory domain-containing protein [Terriglobia bacterium]|nr:carboxypeptidase-like regulatory domain-containing protein [Terriglobia bacterium]
MRVIILSAFLLGQTLSHVDLRTAGVTGHVVDLDGAPAENIRVLAIEGLDPVVDGVPDRIVSLARTDRDGRYVLDGIPPGRYLFAAGPLSAPLYFPGVASLDQASALRLPPGATVPGVDFRVPYASISGRLLYQDGKPAPNVRIALATAPPESSRGQSGKRAAADSAVSTLTGKDGRFTFRNVPMGAYHLAAGPEKQAEFLPTNSNPETVFIDASTPRPILEFRIARSDPPAAESVPADDVNEILRQLIEERRRQ